MTNIWDKKKVIEKITMWNIYTCSRVVKLSWIKAYFLRGFLVFELCPELCVPKLDFLDIEATCGVSGNGIGSWTGMLDKILPPLSLLEFWGLRFLLLPKRFPMESNSTRFSFCLKGFNLVFYIMKDLEEYIYMCV